MSTYLQQAKKESCTGGSTSDRYLAWMSIACRAMSAILLALLLMTSSGRADTPHRVEVVGKRYAFEPAEITVKRGESVELRLTSADVAHGLRIRELKIDMHASKGKTAVTNFTPETLGSFVGHCSIFCGAGHGQMTFTIHVVA